MFNWINSDNNHRLLFIGFDGCRADAISKYISIEKSSVLAQYQRTGELLLGYCGGLNQSYPTSTSPGWTALLTGEWGTINGVVGNNGSTHLKDGHHTVMYNLANTDQTISTSYVSSFWNWDKTWSTDFNPELSNYYFDQSSDTYDYDDIVDKTKINIELNYTANFVILDCCDNAGHGGAFSPTNNNYMQALAASDNYAKDLIECAYNATINPDDNLLVVLTTDHGGINNNHGGFSPEETTTWYAFNRIVI